MNIFGRSNNANTIPNDKIPRHSNRLSLSTVNTASPNHSNGRNSTGSIESTHGLLYPGVQSNGSNSRSNTNTKSENNSLSQGRTPVLEQIEITVNKDLLPTQLTGLPSEVSDVLSKLNGTGSGHYMPVFSPRKYDFTLEKQVLEENRRKQKERERYEQQCMENMLAERLRSTSTNSLNKQEIPSVSASKNCANVNINQDQGIHLQHIHLEEQETQDRILHPDISLYKPTNPFVNLINNGNSSSSNTNSSSASRRDSSSRSNGTDIADKATNAHSAQHKQQIERQLQQQLRNNQNTKATTKPPVYTDLRKQEAYNLCTELGFSHQSIIFAIDVYQADTQQVIDCLTKISSLMEYGFREEQCQEALLLSNHDVQASLQYLQSNF